VLYSFIFMVATVVDTVRGMMYYRKALELQAFLDMAQDDGMSNGSVLCYCSECAPFMYVLTSLPCPLDLMEGYRATELMSEDSQLMTQCKAIADMKFTYVVSCQQYGIQKRSGEPCAHDILRLMTT
jgi:callose synthase